MEFSEKLVEVIIVVFDVPDLDPVVNTVSGALTVKAERSPHTNPLPFSNQLRYAHVTTRERTKCARQ